MIVRLIGHTNKAFQVHSMGLCFLSIHENERDGHNLLTNTLRYVQLCLRAET